MRALFAYNWQVRAEWLDWWRHVLIHEIHHVGQLSIWAREMNVDPVSASYIGRDL